MGCAEQEILKYRREKVFLLLSGIFLGTLATLNILGISRFVDLSFTVFGWRIPFAVAVGVLPYPVTFLCTDLISELYGKRYAAWVVWTGLLLNIWIISVLWVAGALPGFETTDPLTGKILPDSAGRLPVFFEIRALTFGAVSASMIAYMAAQFCDVYIFHWLKDLTQGKHLWLRNNGSTLFSQFVDTIAVILITHFWAGALPIEPDEPLARQLLVFIWSGYFFKLTVALLDTGPAYLGVRILSKYLKLGRYNTSPGGVL